MILARLTEEPAPVSVDREPLPQGYYMQGAVLHGTDDSGRTFYRIHAERLEQDAASEEFAFDDLRVEYSPDTGISWNVTARLGQTDAERNMLRLENDVLLRHTGDASANETTFRTDDLLLNTRESLASTEATVRMQIGRAELEASGFELDLSNDSWTLAPMTGAGRTGFISLLSLAASAAAQEPSTLEFMCESASGRLGEAVWVNCEFSDGTSKVTAGRATSARIDFDGNSWTLSEGVTLATGTIEIAAEEAVLEFSGDQLVSGELKGSPLEMSDYVEERDQRVRGSASSLSYDSAGGEVRLLGDVTFVFGETEFAGCDLIYNFVETAFQTGASDECDNGFRLLGPAPQPGEPEQQSGTP